MSFSRWIGLISLSFALAACGDDDPPAAVCGDGVVDEGEACDDGNDVDGDACQNDCTVPTGPFCGDGTVDAGEECDDGNTIDTDACRNDCTEPVVGPMCGDGTVDAGEECDDGNTVENDGCDNDCTESEVTKIVVCEELAPLPTGTCEVTAGGTTQLLRGDVLTPGVVYRGGFVTVEASGMITCVGCDCEAGAAGATRITCPTGVISPGLINTHDHITFTHNDPYTDTGERYEHRHDWRLGRRGHTEINSAGGASAAQIRWGELRFLMGGATSIVGSGAATGFLRNLDRAQQEGLGQPEVLFDTFPLGDSSGTQLSSGCGYPSMVTTAEIAGEDAYEPHVAEGIDAVSRNEFVCLSMGANDIVEPQSALIHSIALTPPDYGLMAAEGTALIWSPRSNVTLYGDTAQVTTAARMGVEIALGTDWMPTGSMNLLRELRCADELNSIHYGGFFTDEDLWLMVTANAAGVTATNDVIGVLAAGRVADIAIFDGATRPLHRAVIAAEPSDVVLVLRGGKALYGDSGVVSALASGGSCDAVDVCGNAKAVCVSSEISMTLAELEAAAGGIYPAFFCGMPDNEPSCVPTRPDSVDGSTVYTGVPTATDADGDGIDGAEDNCPTVFNPVRPVDAGAQGDFDGDGEGDVCDVCPLDPDSTTCSPPDPNDSDGDGVANAVDVCPNDPDPLQADMDSDGRGDACDDCPAISNPAPAACPGTIYEVKMGTIAVGATLSLSNALVTGRATNGFFLQVKPGDPGYMGEDFSGIFLFNPGNMVAAGDRVNIASATVQNFFGQIQLSSVMGVTVVTSGESPPAPVDVVPADVATGGTRAAALEGVIVRVMDVAVTDVNPPAGPGDATPTNEFVVDGALRVNDFLHLVTPFPTVGETYLSLTGILEFRNGNSKLEPRNAADVVTGPPSLTGLTPETGTFLRVGDMGMPTFPAAMQVVLSGPALAPTFVAVTSSDPAVAVVGGGVTVPTGATTANVLFDGVSAHPSVTITATLDGNIETAAVRVLDGTEQPVIVSLTPATTTIAAGGTAVFTVTLDLPPAMATDVTLDQTPAGAGTLPATVTVPADALSASFSYVDGGTASDITITATLGASSASADVTIGAPGGLVINELDYDQIGTDTNEFVEIYNATGAPVDLTGKALVFVNGSSTPSPEYRRVTLTGTLPAGGYLVVASTTVAVDPGAMRIDFPGAMDQIQNGAPDGVALIDETTSTIIDRLSYEGSITMGSITGFAMPETFVEGMALPAATADSNTTAGSLSRLPDGTDTDESANDWAFTTTPTPGTANVP